MNDRFYRCKLGRVFGVEPSDIDAWADAARLVATKDDLGRRCFTLFQVRDFVTHYGKFLVNPPMDPLRWALFSTRLAAPHAFERGCSKNTMAAWVKKTTGIEYPGRKLREALDEIAAEGVFDRGVNLDGFATYSWARPKPEPEQPVTSNENPYDEKNVRTHDFRCRARFELNSLKPSRMNFILSVTDGPETFEDYDPEDALNPDGENSLTEAITKATNNMIAAAQEQEAGEWITSHEKVYVVQGHTGKLADGPTGAVRWPVKAFLSEERAHDLMRTLNHWCCQVGLARVCYADPMQRLIIDPEGRVAKCPHDPGFRVDETGVLYLIVEAPLDMFDPIREG